MNRKIMFSLFLGAAAMCLAQLSEEDETLFRIMMVESGGRTEVKLHPDKTSFGLFGLTETACSEVGVEWPPKNALEELKAARAYLHLVAKRRKASGAYEAVGFYHGGNKDRRNAYADKVANVDMEEERLAFFQELLKEERKGD